MIRWTIHATSLVFIIIIIITISISTVRVQSSSEGAQERLTAFQEHLHEWEQQSAHLSVSELLRHKLPAGCRYELLAGHPLQFHTPQNSSKLAVMVHLLNGKHWVTHGFYPKCGDDQHDIATAHIFLSSLQPDHCLSGLDLEWVECGGDGYSGVQARAWHGQTYVFFCRESPRQSKPLRPHWIDGGNSLCAVFPTNWVPPPAFFLEVEPIPVLQKRSHPLVTSVISHSYTPVRVDMMAALKRRHISYHQFGSQGRTISITQYLKSFASGPHLQPTEQEHQQSRVEKEDAIRWSKFHLALEHTSQSGYMSEKVWQCLRVGTVPIYYGAPEAGFFLPPHSTIFVRDYGSHDELIDYLLYLDKNDTAYLEYLEWRQLLHQPSHAYTRFLKRYGQGEMFHQHLCLALTSGSSVLQQLQENSQALPFQQNWTHWDSGQQCWLDPASCEERSDFREPPSSLTCTPNKVQLSLQPYSFPSSPPPPPTG